MSAHSKPYARVGEVVRDHLRRRDGVVMDVVGGRLYLRPEGGGIEWTAAPEHVGPAVDASAASRVGR